MNNSECHYIYNSIRYYSVLNPMYFPTGPGHSRVLASKIHFGSWILFIFPKKTYRSHAQIYMSYKLVSSRSYFRQCPHLLLNVVPLFWQLDPPHTGTNTMGILRKWSKRPFQLQTEIPSSFYSSSK